MPEYQFANKDGSIVMEDYDRTNCLSATGVLRTLQDAFALFPYDVEIQQVVGWDDIFHVTYLDKSVFEEIFICGKGTTPGGRKGLTDEQRIQPQAKFLNYVCDKQAEGKKGIFLGVYSRDDQIVFCTWKVVRSKASTEETPISKQIKIDSIAKAIREGFVQYDKGRGEYACAFKAEFLYFYLRNSDWLHSGVVRELAEHTSLEEKDNTTSNNNISFRYYTGLQSEYSRNRILFGAPGTGKSYTLNQDRVNLLGEDNDADYERVTFHPDYSYANFVGTYKPVPYIDSDGKDSITYEYVPGPFMRIFVDALKNSMTNDIKPFLLIVEEINRANVAAVFGDIFQLLDRDDDGVSEYPIQASEDIKRYLARELGGVPQAYTQIRIPDNMFIWATMNSADQGVFPMDTAFKRRWDFTYLGIDDNVDNIRGKYIYLGEGQSQKVEWNKLRKAINSFLANEKINEDKQLGPYFISKRLVTPLDSDEIDREEFIRVFKNKVIMYLFEDAAKQKRSKLFEGCSNGDNRYSAICKEFDEKGIGIFNRDIQIAAGIEIS